MPSSAGESCFLLDAPSARTPFRLSGERVTFSPTRGTSPDAIPIRRSLHTIRYPSGTGADQTGSLRSLTNAATHSSRLTWDGVMGCSTDILKRVGQSSPPALFRNCATSTRTGATPTHVVAFHVKAQIRCLGGIAAPRTGSSGFGGAIPRHNHGLLPTWPWSPWPGRARGKPSASSHCRSSASHESALLQLK